MQGDHCRWRGARDIIRDSFIRRLCYVTVDYSLVLCRYLVLYINRALTFRAQLSRSVECEEIKLNIMKSLLFQET